MNTNLLFFLNTYGDLCPTTTPQLSQFSWTRQVNGIPYSRENDQQIQVPVNTTTPNIIPYPFSSPVATPTTSYDAFTVTSANATVGAVYTNGSNTYTVVQTLVAGTTLYVTSSGTPPSSGTLTLSSGTGDPTITYSAFSGAPYTVSGQNTIYDLISTAGIALGQLIVGSGIPAGTTVTAISGSTVTMSQKATSTGPVALNFYNPASFIYVESDQQISVIYNGGSPMVINPFSINGLVTPGVFFMNGPLYSLTVTNLGAATANVFFALMG